MLPNRYLAISILLSLPLTCFADPASTKYSPQALSCLQKYELNHFEQAFAQCKPLADKNDPMAQYVVAMLYKRGKGITQSQTAALDLLTRSAEGGYAASQLRLGKMLSAGMGASPDYFKAAEYFARAANQHDKDAQFLLALCYQNGLGVAKNPQTAISWFNKAVQNGLEASPLTPPANTLKKSATTLANKTDHHENFALLKLAAEQGESDAQFQVAMHYANGQETAQDDAQAIEWLQKAAAGHNQEAMSYLAWMSMLGLGAPQNVNHAIDWFVSAHTATSDSDSIFAFTPATTQTEAKAKTEAYYNQAIQLLDKQDDTASTTLGLKLLEKAAKSNHALAQTKLAQLYQTGKGVSQSKELAAKWFEKAAKNGNSEAQYALGWIYFNGTGVNKNITQAYYWFNQASAYGGARAKSAKQFVQSQMNANQLADGQKLTGQIAKK